MGQRTIIKTANYSTNAIAKVDLVNSSIIDSNASAYIAAILAVDSTFNATLYQIPINILVKKLKLVGLWDKIDVLHLFAGLTPASQGINLINPTQNEILYFPKKYDSSTETIAKFTKEGYEAHNKTSGSPISHNNIAVMKIGGNMLGHTDDIFFSISGKVKADDAGSISNTFLCGNYTTDSSLSVKGNRCLFTNNSPYGGLGVIEPPFTPSFSLSTMKKSEISYNLAKGELSTYQNATLLQSISADPLDKNQLSDIYFGIGHSTSAVKSVVNDVLQDVNYFAGWGTCNYVFDSLIWGKSLEVAEINMINILMNEFRGSVGRELVS